MFSACKQDVWLPSLGAQLTDAPPKAALLVLHEIPLYWSILSTSIPYTTCDTYGRSQTAVRTIGSNIRDMYATLVSISGYNFCTWQMWTNQK